MYTSLPNTGVGLSNPRDDTMASSHYLFRRAKTPATTVSIEGTIKFSLYGFTVGLTIGAVATSNIITVKPCV